MLFSICKEGKVLPPTCSLFLLPAARHSWTITYRFPTSAANTWERISAPGAPPSLGGALPRYLTAEAGPFRAVIGAAGKGGGHRRETRVSHWIGGMPLSPQTRARCGLRLLLNLTAKGLCSLWHQTLLPLDQGALRGGKLVWWLVIWDPKREGRARHNQTPGPFQSFPEGTICSGRFDRRKYQEQSLDREAQSSVKNGAKYRNT